MKAGRKIRILISGIVIHIIVFLQMTSTSVTASILQNSKLVSSLLTSSAIPPKPTYLVLAGKYLEPGEPFKVAVTLFKNSNRRTYNLFGAPYANLPATVQVQISRKGAVIVSEIRECHFGSTELITVKTPDHFNGNGNEEDQEATEKENPTISSYTLTVEGNIYGGQHGSLFLHQRPLSLMQPDVRIVLESEHPTYIQGQMMQFRIVPLLSNGHRYLDPVDIFLHEPSGLEMARWPARNAVSGPIHVKYRLASETPIGQWRLSASTRSRSSSSRSSSPTQPESLKIHVVNYQPIGFEVQVHMPSSVVPMDSGLYGWIEAKRLRDEAPIFGSLTVKAKILRSRGTTRHQGLLLCEGSMYFSAGNDNSAQLSLGTGDSASIPILGKLKWSISQSEIYDNLCGGRIKSSNETKLKLEASVTNAKNEQLVRAHASSIIYPKDIRMGFSIPSPAVIHPDMPFMAWIWAQRADGKQFSYHELDSLKMKILPHVQYTKSSSWEPLPSYQLFGRKKNAQKHKYLWKLTFDLPKALKNHSTGIPLFKKIKLQANLQFNLGDLKTEGTSSLILLPPKLNPFGSQLQITSSTKKPKLGENIILHVRSNFDLEDFHCIVTSRGRLLTTRLISMGHTKLKTFDEIVTFNMAPQATFLVWHVDNWGRMITASVTVPIFAHNRGHLDAHPVLEGSSGYTQLTLSGEPNSLIMLNALNQDILGQDNNPYEEVMHKSIVVSQSNGLVGTNLLVMSDRKTGFQDEKALKCADQGLFECEEGLNQKNLQKCYNFLDICDRKCQCPNCQDELKCGGGGDGHHGGNFKSPEKLFSSPTLKTQKSTGFWNVVKMPPNGTLSLKVPFNTDGRLFLQANSLGTKGIAALGSRIINVGTDVKFQMELPKSAKIGEVLSLRISAINRGNIHVRRRFSLYSPAMKSFVFLSAYGKMMDMTSKLVTIEVPPSSQATLQVPIKPLILGRFLIRARPTDESEDYLTAEMEIYQEGIEIAKSSQMLIDLSTRPYFMESLKIPFPDRQYAMNSKSSQKITLTRGLIGPIVVHFPYNISDVLNQPQITADEAVFILAQLHLYRENSDVRKYVDDSIDVQTAQILAYQRLLSYKNSDGGSFGFCQNIPSTYLTSSALDILRRLYHSPYSGQRDLTIDGFLMRNILKWIIQQQSEINGSFQEKFIFDGIYQRKIPIEFQEIALTAHVLISLSGIDPHDFGGLNISGAKNHAAKFLSSRLEILDRSGSALDIALVARALQLSKSEGSEAAFEILAKNRHEESSHFFWGHEDECEDALSVRATALALMIYVDRGEFYTEPIVRWLNSQRISASGWGSTVNTMYATEALILWSKKYKPVSSNHVEVALEVDTNEGKRAIVLADDNLDQLNHVIKLQNPSKEITIEAKGHGLALVHLSTKYFTTQKRELEEGGQNQLSAFNLEPRIEIRSVESSLKTHSSKLAQQRPSNQLLVLSCQRWNCQKDLSVSGPAVFTMGIPTGYILDTEELHRIQSYGYKAWNTEGNVVIFFHRLTPDYECVNFTLRSAYPVSKLSSYIPVEIRDWYAPERKNTTLVFLPEMNSISVCDVCGSSDCPHCGKSVSDLQLSLSSHSNLTVFNVMLLHLVVVVTFLLL